MQTPESYEPSANYREPVSYLTSSQRAAARIIIDSMVETLELDREEIRLIIDDPTPTGRQVLAMDTSPNGQYIGLYKTIIEQRTANPDWYTLFIDGERIDPLAGCTQTAYRAMITDARARGVIYLPDSLALNQYNGHVWTATMLTGDPLPSKDHIWIGSSSGGLKVNFVEQPIHRGGRSFRVRPTVAVAKIKE